MSKNILILVGTRPEAIKMAPVVRELRQRASFGVRLCATGQHREMLAQALGDFGLSPDVNLDIMQPDQTLAGLTAGLFAALDGLYATEQPDMVLVQGDTTTVMTAAMTAFYRNIRVGHVEAGLRSFDKRRPFPEEVNRKVAGCVADLHFAPTDQARANLLAEGVAADSVFVTGNTVIDALQWMAAHVQGDTGLLPPAVVAARAAGKRIILVTGHRRESFDGGFGEICAGIRHIANERDDVFFVYPVHLNPHVHGPVFELLTGHPRIHLMEPLSYRPFVALMQAADLVLTDSGGIQEEAPALGKPVLVMRDVTERPEGIAAGNARLVGAHASAIEASVTELLDNPQIYATMSHARNPYGDGAAARHIADVLEQYWAVEHSLLPSM